MSTDVTDVYRCLPMSTRFGTEVDSKNLDSKKVSFYLKPGNASDQRHLVTGV